MNQLPITTADIWAIPLPADWHTFSKSSGNIMRAHDAKNNVFNTNISLMGFELLGTCTKDYIDFDAKLIVDKHSLENGDLYYNYTGDNLLTSSDASFKTAIETAGYYFVNPLGNRPVPDDYDDWDYGNSAYKNWVAAQQSVVEKLVIIKNVTPCKK